MKVIYVNTTVAVGPISLTNRKANWPRTWQPRPRTYPQGQGQQHCNRPTMGSTQA